jgi:ribonuclease VapC
VIFIDTSVVVAILAAEDDAAYWSERIAAAPYRATSTLVLIEGIMRLSTLRALEPDRVNAIIEEFLATGQIEVIAIEVADKDFAVDAFARYGKGRRHPARLNLADCLSYACAKRRGLRLLYKGDDFAKTDMG